MSIRRFMLTGVLLLAAGALGLRLAFFALSTARVPASSDEVLSILQAEKLMADGRPPLLVLANPYQFPVETYAHLPLVRLLPRTALGARLVPFLLSLAATALFLAALLRAAPRRDAWPGLLLILIPPAYLLMIGSAYFIPQHSSFALLGALALALAFGLPGARRPGRAALAAGFSAGLAVSNHLLAWPLLVMLGLYAAFRPAGARGGAAVPAAFALGAAAGLLPLALALALHPGAYSGDVSGIVSPALALRRAWGMGLNGALSGVMGISPCLFPDGRARLWWAPHANAAFAAAWLALMLAAAGLCAWRGARRWRAAGRVSLEAPDVVIGIAWLTFASYCFSARSLSHTFRYLLPAAWMVPFAVAFLYGQAPRPARRALGAAAVLLAGFHAAAGLALMRAWAQPGFAVRAADLVDLRPALRALDARGIRHAVASYWLAYRVTFESGGRVLCCQPWNERFPGWGVPFKDRVDAAADTAYLTAPRLRFDTRRFEADLAAMGVAARRDDLGDVALFTEFRAPAALRGAPLPPAAWRAAASHNGARAGALLDGDDQSVWRTDRPQAAGLWIELRADAPPPVAALALAYPVGAALAPRRLALETWSADGRPLPGGAPDAVSWEPFAFRHGHPVYGAVRQVFRVPPAPRARLRLSVVEPTPGSPWAIGEIEVCGPPP